MPKHLYVTLRRIVEWAGKHDFPLWGDVEQPSSPLAVPRVIGWLTRGGDRDCAKLAHFLAGLMRNVGPRDWTGLYSRSRSPEVRPGDVARLEQLPPDDAVEMLGVATLSYNGYTRQAAVRALRRLEHPRAVPYVLLRLGDWVPQVRQSAVGTLRLLMDRGVAAQLIEHHYLLEHLPLVRRVNLKQIGAEIREVLQSAASRPALESGLTNARAGTRLFCLRLLADELPDQPELVARAIRDKDPAVRGWIADMVARAELVVSEEVFQSLLCDKSSRVGTTMIRMLKPQQVESCHNVLLDLVMADARPVRASARFVLTREETFDFASTCRSRLDAAHSDAIRPGWVACLGETGDTEDFDRLSALLDHRRSRIRAAAVIAAGRIDRDRAAPEVVRFLSDTSGHVRRAAIGVLSKATPALWIAAAHDVLATGPERGRTAALNALTTRIGWDAVPALLLGLVTDSEVVRQRAWQGIHDWQRRHGSHGWTRPSAECLAAISRAWPHVRDRRDAPHWAASNWSELRLRIEQIMDEVAR